VSACLNCGATVSGAFCGACGQRVIPAYPTVREMAGDAWEELSGYDGRFARTFRLLLRSPGALTLEVLEGRRARYVSPVRLYLVASLIYFIVAAVSPNLNRSFRTPNDKLKIDLSQSEDALNSIPAEERETVLKDLDRAPWWMRDLLKSVVQAPVAFRRRYLEYLPRALFTLVPVFAGIVALFYRRGRFLIHLIFALHVHAAVFVALSFAQLSNFSRSVGFASVCGLITFAFIVVYSLLAFRRVYRESWPRTLVKSAGVATLYLIAGLTALTGTFVWAAMA
jgi:hypothetical protein